MENNLNRFNLNISTGRIAPQPTIARPAAPTPEVSFDEVLKQKLQTEQSSIVFSKHAMHRIEQRNIDISADKVARLNQGIDMAQQKGLGDVLVLVDKTAFIVNAQNRAVITTMTGNETVGNVFTNIEGTVIV